MTTITLKIIPAPGGVIIVCTRCVHVPIREIEMLAGFLRANRAL